MEVTFLEDEPSSFKIFILEPSENLDFELENHQISRFAILKWDFSDSGGPPKLN